MGSVKTLICVPAPDDTSLLDRFKYAKSILALKYNTSLCWKLLTRYLLIPGSSNEVAMTESFTEPMFLFEEDIDSVEIQNISESIDSLSLKERSIAKIALSLYYDSVFTKQVYDGLLKLWFAIEVLCKLPNTNKKQPIKDKIESIYGDSKYDPLIDLIYKIRNSITHDGYSGGIPGGILGVSQSLFYDLLSNHCNVVSPRKTEKAIAFYELDVSKCKLEFNQAYNRFFE